MWKISNIEIISEEYVKVSFTSLFNTVEGSFNLKKKIYDECGDCGVYDILKYMFVIENDEK